MYPLSGFPGKGFLLARHHNPSFSPYGGDVRLQSVNITVCNERFKKTNSKNDLQNPRVVTGA